MLSYGRKGSFSFKASDWLVRLKGYNRGLSSTCRKPFSRSIFLKIDYISKMDFILHDNSKFENLGPSSEFDNTVKIEAHIQRRLLQLKKEGLLPSKIYSRIRPTGSQRPRMYGLPKIHKQDVPLRPILSMTGSAQHQLAQWLTSVIDPVLSLYSTYCISDSFTFADKVKTFNFPPSVFLCSYDVCSLFTNVPFA